MTDPRQLRLTDDLRYHLAMVRRALDIANASALVDAKVQLADGVLAALERRRVRRLDRVGRPAAARVQAPAQRRRTA